jgi:hypothetical protein
MMIVAVYVVPTARLPDGVNVAIWPVPSRVTVPAIPGATVKVVLLMVAGSIVDGADGQRAGGSEGKDGVGGIVGDGSAHTGRHRKSHGVDAGNVHGLVGVLLNEGIGC